MKSYIIILFLLFSFYACRDRKSSASESENNIDATRNFIRAALDGKFNEARKYLLADSVNTNFMDVVERSYANTDQATKDGYREASIRIQDVHQVNDSVTIVIYSNSFKNNPDTLKVLKIKDKWLVDLKYLYLHDMDSTVYKPVEKDSLP